MRRAILSLALVCSVAGCANTNKGQAVQLVMASDAVADEIADAWDPGVDAQIAHCKATLGDEPSKDARDDCMALFGKGEGLEVATQLLVTTQTAIAAGVKCEKLQTCPQEVDWAELKTSALDAWNALRPYYEAIKKGK